MVGGIGSGAGMNATAAPMMTTTAPAPAMTTAAPRAPVMPDNRHWMAMPPGRCPPVNIQATVTLINVCPGAACAAKDVLESFSQLNGGFLSKDFQDALEHDNDRDHSGFCHGCELRGSRLQEVDVNVHPVNRRSLDLDLKFDHGVWRCDRAILELGFKAPNGTNGTNGTNVGTPASRRRLDPAVTYEAGTKDTNVCPAGGKRIESQSECIHRYYFPDFRINLTGNL